MQRAHKHLALILAFSALGHVAFSNADELEDACAFTYAKLQSIAGAQLNRTIGEFTYLGQRYRGCIAKLSGDKTKVTGAYYPPDLFYPFENTARYNEGWRADNEADGPDGTSFRIFKGNTFCHVEGNWDGGDDSDPKYIPSPRLEIIVSCGRVLN